jgi:hypothetical protein
MDFISILFLDSTMEPAGVFVLCSLIAFAIVGTAIIVKICQFCAGIRVSYTPI